MVECYPVNTRQLAFVGKWTVLAKAVEVALRRCYRGEAPARVCKGRDPRYYRGVSLQFWSFVVRVPSRGTYVESFSWCFSERRRARMIGSAGSVVW